MKKSLLVLLSLLSVGAVAVSKPNLEYEQFLKLYASGRKPDPALFERNISLTEGRVGLSTSSYSWPAEVVIFSYETLAGKQFFPSVYAKGTLSEGQALTFARSCQSPAYYVDDSLPRESAVRQKILSWWLTDERKFYPPSEIFLRQTEDEKGQRWLLYAAVCGEPNGCPKEGTKFGEIGPFAYFKISPKAVPEHSVTPLKDGKCGGLWVTRTAVMNYLETRRRIVAEKEVRRYGTPSTSVGTSYEPAAGTSHEPAVGSTAQIFPSGGVQTGIYAGGGVYIPVGGGAPYSGPHSP
jgi:hypothetical protein